MDEDLIRSEITQGLLQVDSSLSITDFFIKYDEEKRKMTVSFTAQTDSGEEIKVVNDFA